MNEERVMGQKESFQSWRFGKRLRRLNFAWMKTCSIDSSRLQNTSATAKSPTATPMKPAPSSRERKPKVNRSSPLTASTPTQATMRPKTPLIRPFTMDSPARLVTSVRPMKARAKYSGGPKERAKPESGGAINVSSTTARVPAIYDANAAMPSAGAARPFLASAYPSRQVTTEADSP